MAPFSWPADMLEAQRGHLFPWAPVLLALGIGSYFTLRVEPGLPVYGAIVAGLVVLGLARSAFGPRMTPFLLVVALTMLGFALAGLRAHLVAEPVLGFRYYGPITGRIVVVDRSSSDKLRLTLDRVLLARMAPERTPGRVRVSLHGEQGFIDPEPGQTVMLTGHLSPPQGPVEPDGFDFRRMAWFNGLGAVGYTRSPVVALEAADQGAFGLWVQRLRMRISGAVQQALPGEGGAFAAAILTGDRSGMGRDTLDDLRASNLAHLLAISGLHMGLLTGFVFAAMRYALVAIPWVGLRLPVKKIAALAGLGAGAFYYLLSGGNVATERAFIMVAVMLTAVLFDRRALTLRAVAMAAIIVLTMRPESLTGPGFQMSFAATTALVAIFGAIREWDGPQLPRMLRPVAALVISSAVAGAATGPVAAAHFNRIADYGLIANLLSVPLMGAIVMPAAVLTACLTPLGLSWIGLGIMRPAIEWILGVAHYVAGMEGAVTPVISPPATVLPLFALGSLWVILWRARGRSLGVIPVAAALLIWTQAERPPVLIAASGGLVGMMSEAGRVLSKPRGDSFSALNWLENDGDAALQAAANGRADIAPVAGIRRFNLEGKGIVHLSGRGAVERIAEACQTAAVVVIARDAPGPSSCTVLDETALRETGSVAIYADQGKLRLVTANERSGRRLWSPQ